MNAKAGSVIAVVFAGLLFMLVGLAGKSFMEPVIGSAFSGTPVAWTTLFAPMRPARKSPKP